MRKEYECPKAEKVEFDYKEVVVASICQSGKKKVYVRQSVVGGCEEEYIGTEDVWNGKDPQ